MGGEGEPELRVLDGGKCFSCHKNRGPILGAAPWSNSAHDDILRLSAAGGLRLSGTSLPTSGPFALGPPARRTHQDRIDGMALATPEAAAVDFGVRLGANLRLNRDIFRLMTRTPDGQRALVILLAAVVGPGPLDSNDKSVKQALDAAFERSFLQFAADWVELQKEARPNMLIDIDPASLLEASGVRPYSPAPIRPTQVPVVRVPGLVGGSGSRWAAPRSPAAQAAAAARAAAACTEGDRRPLRNPGRTEPLRVCPVGRLSWPHQQGAAKQPAGVLQAAGQGCPAAVEHGGHRDAREHDRVDGGDRKFLATTLADAAKRVNTPKATAATLARSVFEGPEFAELLAGGPLPDRDEFKDRFVAGLEGVMKTSHGLPLFVTRKEYASGPKYDPKAVEEKEVAVVPTTACLRCHDIRGPGKAPGSTRSRRWPSTHSTSPAGRRGSGLPPRSANKRCSADCRSGSSMTPTCLPTTPRSTTGSASRKRPRSTS